MLACFKVSFTLISSLLLLFSHSGWLFATPWTAVARPLCPPLSPKVCSDLRHWVVDAIQPSHSLRPFSFCPLLLPASGSFPVIWVFASRGQSIGASASVPSSEDSQLISRIDCCDLLAVQGTLSPKASVLQHSAFFMVQLSCPYMTARKTTALTLQTLDGKVMSLLFNTLSRFVMVFLLRSKHLLISWLQSPSAVILEPKIKSVTASTVSWLAWKEFNSEDCSEDLEWLKLRALSTR